jgi:hypothetical protein
MTAADLSREGADVRLPTGPPTARTFDMFGTANFINFKPWAATVEYQAVVARNGKARQKGPTSVREARAEARAVRELIRAMRQARAPRT